MLLTCDAGEVPWTAGRSNQYILKEISPEYSLEGLMLKLKLQYFGHLMCRADLFAKTPMLGKIEGRRRRGWQRMRWLDGSLIQWTWVWASSGRWYRKGSLVCCSPWGSKELDMTEWLNWTELNWQCFCLSVWLFVYFFVNSFSFESHFFISFKCFYLFIGLLQFCGIFLFFFLF